VPIAWIWLIRAASWIVPASQRRAWREKRVADVRAWLALLAERGEAGHAQRARVRRFCWRSFADAAAERFPGVEAGLLLRRVARSPRFLVASLVFLLLTAVLSTGLVSKLRTLYAPLPYQHAEQLVAAYQLHFLSASLGVQARYVEPWREQAKTLRGVAAYRIARFRLAGEGMPEREVDGARVTEDFFDVLGVQARLGRTFREGEPLTPLPVVLSHELWRRLLRPAGRGPGALVTLDGRRAIIIGVLPERFWFRSPRLAVWTVLPGPVSAAQAPRLIGAIARMQPGVTVSEAFREMDLIARRTSRFQGGALRVAPLTEFVRPEVGFALLELAVGAAAAFGISVVQSIRSWRRRRGMQRETARYWVFFLIKSALLMLLIAAVAAAMAATNAMGLHRFKFLVGMLIDWVVLLAVLMALRWAVLDQARRCPVCLRRLAMPYSSGSWSSPLLEPAHTELLCDQGHGALQFSEGHSSFGEIRRWIALEDSWKEMAAPDKTSP